MAFPNLISTSDNTAIGFPGPILAPNGALYTFLVDSGANKIAAFISFDGGVNWFNVTSVGPSDDTSTTFCVVLRGTVIWCINKDPGTGNQALTPFDTSSATWGTTTVTTNGASTFNGPVSAALRSTDNQLVIAGQPSSLRYLGRIRTGFFTFDPVLLTWTAWTGMGYQINDTSHSCECGGILPGPSGLMNFIIWTYGAPLTANPSQLQNQTLTSGDVLGALTTIDSVTLTGTAFPTYPQGYSDGTKAVIIWKQKDADTSVKVYEAPTSTWVWSAPQTLTLAASETALGSIAVTISAGTYFAFLYSYDSVVHPNTTSIWVAQDTGSGFGALSLVGTIPTSETGVPPFALWAAPLGSVAPWGIVFFANSNEYVYFWAGALAPNPCPCYLHCPGGDALTIYCTPCSPPLTCCTCKV